jgi:succinoglycan biosynthesis transport protein ExoP
MSIIQFLRIIWARAPLIIACTIFTFLGGFIVTFLVQPRYEATSRVMLNVMKPDPVSGAAPEIQVMDAYVQTQQELVKDYQVTAPVVDKLGWLTDPTKIAQYQARPASDTRDFRRWLSQQVGDRANARLVRGTIFEISFTSPSAIEARNGADALRESFINYSLSARRLEASRNAAWYAQQAEAQRHLAEEAQLATAAFERENGIIVQGGDKAGSGQDLDSARLAALVSQSASAPTAALSAPVNVTSTSKLQLAQIDAQIAQNADKLGPNHPQMQQLRAQRALVASVVAQEEAAAKAGPNNSAAIGALSRELAQQKSVVISQRDKIERLRQLQSEVDLRREQYQKTAQRAADLTLEAGVADSRMSPLGVTVAPTHPAFPNKTLIIGGALGLGGGLGLVLAVLIELLNRRVRGFEDLELDRDVHCLAVIGSAPRERRSKVTGLLPRQDSIAGAGA